MKNKLPILIWLFVVIALAVVYLTLTPIVASLSTLNAPPCTHGSATGGSAVETKRTGVNESKTMHLAIVQFREYKPSFLSSASAFLEESENVEPLPRTPTIPPGFAVDKGEVWIGMYLDGTYPFGTLPTILTVYLYTLDEGLVRFSVNYTISVEQGSAWVQVESGTIMSGTVSMPGKYSKIYNARIAHLVEKAALLAAQSGMPAVVAFYGRAVRLDTNKTCSAYLAVPVLPGHLPAQPSANVTVHVYDAVTLSPIGGASVNLTGPAALWASTNSSGYAHFENVPNGPTRSR